MQPAKAIMFAPVRAAASANAFAVSSDECGCDGWPFTTTGQPAASAEAPATAAERVKRLVVAPPRPQAMQ